MNTTNKRILVVSIGDPNTRAAWSGTPYYAYKELRERFDNLELVSTPKLDRVIDFAGRFARLIGIDIRFEPWVREIYSRIVDRHIKKLKPNVLVSIGATYKVCDIKSSIPIIHVSDALFCTITGYYRNYRGLSARTRRTGRDSQQSLLGKDTWLLLTSDWAKEEAEKSYVVDPQRVLVNPIGANVDGSVRARSDEHHKTLKMLFVGKDWERKGGGILIDVFKVIKTSLPDAQLDIVGCDPAEARNIQGVTIHGFLDKAKVQELRKLRELFDSASFFAMLSIEEAFGLVYCEAAAFGLPSLAMKTGGVPTIVRDGETGLLFEIESSPHDIADRVLRLWADRESYEAMRIEARNRFDSVLNWSVWGNRIESKIARIVTNEGRVGMPVAVQSELGTVQ